VAGRAAPGKPIARPGSITEREREVLALLAAGLTNREIGERLHVGITTVKSHVASMMTKTGCQNRIELALLADRVNRSS
jgi:DNA-binding NarL/FixJ family response regulator